MLLSALTIENFRCFGQGDRRGELSFKRGLTALVGENEAGKTAVIDALRLVLGTTDQERVWLEDTDFFEEDQDLEIRISCVFNELTESDQGAFAEFLTYSESVDQGPFLQLTWIAKTTAQTSRGRALRRVELHSGKNGTGPVVPQDVRDLMRVTYLRPLRDAQQLLSAGRGSRLSQILTQTKEVRDGGVAYDQAAVDLKIEDLSVLGIADLANHLLGNQRGVLDARTRVEEHLAQLSLAGDPNATNIKIGGRMARDEVRLRQLLEKLELTLDCYGGPGLGSSNLLFMACEFLLLAQEEEAFRLLVIEEPEAHLHAQRQLQVTAFLQEQAAKQNVQVIMTTHSPTLASVIALDNLVMLQNGRAYSMTQGATRLDGSDYRFLERFLDATKANLFFARSVMIVEGDAENLLLPTLAKLLGLDFTKLGVSIVNVGGIGLRRYARIFQRSDQAPTTELNVRVSCVTDMDVMPDCAPEILGYLKTGDPWPDKGSRRWRVKRDFASASGSVEAGLAARRADLDARASGQSVRTYIADEWTLEYDLALTMAEDVYVAACQAQADEAISLGAKLAAEVESEARTAFKQIADDAAPKDGCAKEEVIAATVYAMFAKRNVSKAVAAQYLASLLAQKSTALQPDEWRQLLPLYLVQSIEHAARVGDPVAAVPA